MTTVFGFDLDDQALKGLAKGLKRQCGTGGSVKDGMIVVQGDHRDAVKGFLEGEGFRVKVAGGYCFVPNAWFHKRLKVTLGRPEQWLCYSDHVPLVVEVEM